MIKARKQMKQELNLCLIEQGVDWYEGENNFIGLVMLGLIGLHKEDIDNILDENEREKVEEISEDKIWELIFKDLEELSKEFSKNSKSQINKKKFLQKVEAFKKLGKLYLENKKKIKSMEKTK